MSQDNPDPNQQLGHCLRQPAATLLVPCAVLESSLGSWPCSEASVG